MKLGVFSDVHGNLEALDAVQQAYQQEQIDEYIFLGDAVGYGANPNECCEIIRSLASISLLGNHDAACCGKTDVAWFVDHARVAIDWSMKILTPENLQWLSSLDYQFRKDSLIFSHGSPIQPENFDYVLDSNQAASIFKFMNNNSSVVFVGHAHYAFSFFQSSDQNSSIYVSMETNLQLKEGNNYIFSLGSVGQPRDGDYRASYSIFDTESMLYLCKRVDYDVHSASRKIEKAGLPEILSQRLLVGR
jgi:diadenosine tetraphosphatase ApaH/serine/threonine PP2A family protein phosphatase